MSLVIQLPPQATTLGNAINSPTLAWETPPVGMKETPEKTSAKDFRVPIPPPM